MKLRFWSGDLRLAHRWEIASIRTSASQLRQTVMVELTDNDGVSGIGEASLARTYGQIPASSMGFCAEVDPARLSFTDLDGSMAYLEGIAPGRTAANCAFNIALMDGAARLAHKPVYNYLGLGFGENKHLTSFSIGIDTPDVIRTKVVEAAHYPVLKLNVGDADEFESLAALREIAPRKKVRVDANEGWHTREQAMERIEWLARDGNIQLIEQPMPRTTPAKDLIWLKERSPIPLIADESYRNEADIPYCADCFHGINLKLIKAGGIQRAYDELHAARRVGLKTMIGCMIESSVLVTAAAHLAELADYLDLDGNLLITNDPYSGVTAEYGLLSFAGTVAPHGLRVTNRLTASTKRSLAYDV